LPEAASDEELMERFCQGDEAAFEALFSRHASGVQAFLQRMVRDRPLAEDLTQTAFLSFVRARGRWVRGSGVRPWLYGIAANAARDTLRRSSKHLEDVSATGELPAGDSVAPALSDPALARQLEGALARIPEQQREAVILHHLDGFSFAEIAETLGVSVTAAKLRAHRGYEKLRELLGHLEGEAS
jgi:RNA polymerase sigma-70 factor (ECF subfamily)